MTDTTPQPSDETLARPVYRPAQLIVTDALYRVLGIARGLAARSKDEITPAAIADDSARHILNSIAVEAHPELVYRALAAVGGPASADECAQRLRAAVEAGTRVDGAAACQ